MFLYLSVSYWKVINSNQVINNSNFPEHTEDLATARQELEKFMSSVDDVIMLKYILLIKGVAATSQVNFGNFTPFI